MLKLKIKLIVFFLIILTCQSCVTNHLLSFEDDDVYFTKEDIVSEKEMERYLESKVKKLNKEEEYEPEINNFE